MVGQYPGVTGPGLAAAFGERVGREVFYEQITPESLRESMAPLIGADAAADVAEVYRDALSAPDREISPHMSAQTILGITPSTTREWLDGIGF